MNEGKELLYKIIEDKINTISQIDSALFTCDGINLIELLSSIEENYEHFYLVTDNILDQVLKSTNYKNATSFKKDIIKVRDLLIGKKDYNLNVKLTKEYKNNIDIFIKELRKYLDKNMPGLVNYEEIEKECLKIKNSVVKHMLITNFEFIEELARSYDEISFDKNMITIMKYINEHNLNIIKNHKKTSPVLDIHLIRKPKLDDKIKEILDKFEVKPRELPNYILSEFKNCDVQEVYETYITLKKNKAEDYGLLHLIKKDNLLAKLIMILYATPESIKRVVDSTKDSKENIDINVLKILINNIMSCFLVKKNDYFSSKHDDFMLNIKMLKELGVNYKSLINKNPLFMITNNEVLDYTLKYLEKNGANKKYVINRCYKILSINPSLLIDNVEIMRNYNINISEYFDEKNVNYNLLKTSGLDLKLAYITKKYKLIKANPLNHDLVNKILVSKVYRESKGKEINWGEESD